MYTVNFFNCNYIHYNTRAVFKVKTITSLLFYIKREKWEKIGNRSAVGTSNKANFVIEK